MKNKSFTLIELLVVIVIVGVLAGVIMVTVSSSVSNATLARAKAFSSNVQNSMLLNLVSEWTFDNIPDTYLNTAIPTTSNYIADEWGVNDGTVYGDPDLKNGNNCVFGKCISFDGSGDYIDCGNNYSLNITDEVTISMWAKSQEVNSNVRWLIGKGLYREAFLLGFYNEKLMFHGSSDGSSWIYSVNGGTVQNNTWYYIVLTLDKINGVKLYKNGSLSGDDSNVYKLKSTQNNDLYIGRRGYSDEIHLGSIDDVRIYDAALSSAQIKQNYIAGLNSMLANGNISEEEFNQRINNLATK
ncbi:MAG: LamG domain-containing protein [Candidatus Pacebacteria bacterium]|nr:LamG domain-containing protein [Candidatus Paceibacterota bacterium]